jgi:hypothetical protein
MTKSRVAVQPIGSWVRSPTGFGRQANSARSNVGTGAPRSRCYIPNRYERALEWAEAQSRLSVTDNALRAESVFATIQRLRSLEGRVSMMILWDIQGHDGPANRAQ